jgi:hypothetical protein
MAVMLGSIVGSLLLIALPTLIGFGVMKKMNKDREFDSTVTWPRNIGVVLSLIFLISTCSSIGRSELAKNESAGVGNKVENGLYVYDGPEEDEYPDEIDPVSLDDFRKQLDAVSIAAASKTGRSVTLTSRISTVKIAGKTVIKYEGKVVGGPYFQEFLGVLDGRRKVISCASDQQPSMPRCMETAVETLDAANTNKVGG